MRLRLLFLYILILAISANVYSAANRETLTISGILKDTSGNFLNGDYNIDFNIITSSNVTVYDENHNGSQAPKVTVSNGYFAVTLGDTNVLPVTLFNGSDYNLTVSVNSNGWMTPSMRLTSVASAVSSVRAVDFNIVNDLNVTRNLKVGDDLNVGNRLNVYDFNALYFRISSYFGSDLNAQYYRQIDANTIFAKFSDMNLQYYSQTDANAVLWKQSDLNAYLPITYYQQTDANTIFAKFSDMNLQYFSQSDANAVLMKKADMNSQYARLNATNAFTADVNVAGVISGLDLNASRSLLIGTGASVGPVTLTYDQLVSNSGAVTLDDDLNVKGVISALDLNASRDINAKGNLYVIGNASKILLAV